MKHIKAVVSEKHQSFSIALVVSQFNSEITQALLQGALDRLEEAGVHSEDIIVVEVPGAVEIPLVVQKLADKNRFKVIVALGAIIRGETSHYDYVCQQVSQGCQHVALQCELPIVFGVLTTENNDQAWDRLGGHHGHKGREAAECALAMQSVMQQLDMI